MKTTWNDGAYQSFKEETPGELDGKTGYYVQQGTAEDTVALLGAGKPIGVVHQKLRKGEPDVTIRMIGSGGVYRAVAGAVLAKDARVKPANGGKAVAATAAALATGTKLDQGSSADGDLISVHDLPYIEAA